METKPLTYDEALNRMREFASSPSGIRCAMFKLEFAEGNKTLDQGDEQ
jgi:predicted double-glycine peptidase